MGARLKSHEEGAAAGRFGGLLEGDHFGVGATELTMVTLAGEPTLAVEHYRAYHRIRRDATPTASGELECAIHPAMIGIAPIGEGV